MVKCIWCNGGDHSNRTKGKDGLLYYYVCQNCVGLFIKGQDEHAKSLLEVDENGNRLFTLS